MASGLKKPGHMYDYGNFKWAKSPFTKRLNSATRATFKNDSVVKAFNNRSVILGNLKSATNKVMSSPVGKRTTTTLKAISRGSRKMARPVFKGLRGAGKAGIFGSLAVGAIAMVGVGIMRGAMNQAQEVVNQRYIQDQRFARNITMMSRLGYSSGTSSMNRFNHTAGLSQALSANRHGRGGY